MSQGRRGGNIPRISLLTSNRDTVVPLNRRNAEEQAIQKYWEERGNDDPTPVQIQQAREALGSQLQQH